MDDGRNDKEKQGNRRGRPPSRKRGRSRSKTVARNTAGSARPSDQSPARTLPNHNAKKPRNPVKQDSNAPNNQRKSGPNQSNPESLKNGTNLASSNDEAKPKRHSKKNKKKQEIPDHAQLKCRPMEPPQQVLWWHCPLPYVPREVEDSLLKVVIRWHKRERKMMKDQPSFRLPQIKKACKASGGRMTVSQALSMRRHHMKLLNPYLSLPQLGLGAEADIRKSAELFEETIHVYLESQKVAFYREDEQRAHFKKHTRPGTPMVPTPDFLLQDAIQLKLQNDQQTIHWIEVKMFYGSSSIPQGPKDNCVGNVMNTARKYVKAYGPGAMVFMYGCGEDLANLLASVGVKALGCHERIDLTPVQEHQRTWCANDRGEILP